MRRWLAAVLGCLALTCCNKAPATSPVHETPLITYWAAAGYLSGVTRLELTSQGMAHAWVDEPVYRDYGKTLIAGEELQTILSLISTLAPYEGMYGQPQPDGYVTGIRLVLEGRVKQIYLHHAMGDSLPEALVTFESHLDRVLDDLRGEPGGVAPRGAPRVAADARR